MRARQTRETLGVEAPNGEPEGTPGAIVAAPGCRAYPSPLRSEPRGPRVGGGVLGRKVSGGACSPPPSHPSRGCHCAAVGPDQAPGVGVDPMPGLALGPYSAVHSLEWRSTVGSVIRSIPLSRISAGSHLRHPH